MVRIHYGGPVNLEEPIYISHCYVPWKYCKEHNFVFLYGKACPHCIEEKKMKYLEGSFSVHPGASKAYRDNWDRIFNKDKKNEDEEVKASDENSSTDEPKEVPVAPAEMLEETPKSKKKEKKNGKK